MTYLQLRTKGGMKCGLNFLGGVVFVRLGIENFDLSHRWEVRLDLSQMTIDRYP